MNEGAQHRQLTILGMLLDRPMYGHQIKETIDIHMDGLHDLKRANLYYLLDRMADQGYLEARMEPVDSAESGDGRAVERRVYHVTPAGRTRFEELLRQVMVTVEPMNSPVDAAFFFLPRLDPADAVQLIQDRRDQVQQRYQRTLQGMAQHPGLSPLHDLTTDHLLAQYRLELDWLERAKGIIEKTATRSA